MDAVNLFNNVPVGVGDAQRASDMATGVSDSDNAKKIKVAKDFEAILVGQLMNQMKETIGDSGLFEDSSTKQIQDMFWDFLGEDVGKKGGFGLWKNIYKSMSPDETGDKVVEGGKQASLKLNQTA